MRKTRIMPVSYRTFPIHWLVEQYITFLGTEHTKKLSLSSHPAGTAGGRRGRAAHPREARAGRGVSCQLALFNAGTSSAFISRAAAFESIAAAPTEILMIRIP